MQNELGWWQSFLDSLASAGGQYLVYFALIGIGTLLLHVEPMLGATTIAGAIGGLQNLIRTAPTNRQQRATDPSAAPPDSDPPAAPAAQPGASS